MRVLFLLLLSVAAYPPVRAQAPPHPATAPNRTSHSSFESISQQAEAARTANQIDEAIALYRKGTVLKPAWDDGWWNLGSLNYDLDQYADARDAFRHLTLLKPDAAIAWGMLGLCEFQTREYDKSLLHLHHSIELGIEGDQKISDVMHYHYGLLLARSGEFEEAMRVFAAFAQRNLNQPDYVEAIGIAALRKPLLPSELPPTERELILDTGRAMYDAAALKTAEAALEFKALVDKYPTEPNVHFVYGSFLLFSDVNAGLAEIKKELDVSPGNVPALVTLASQYLEMKEYQSALPFAEKAVAVDPQSFPAHAVLGRILSEGDVDSARGLKELETARDLAPGSPQVRIALASAYSRSGRKDDAARERQQFLKLKKIADDRSKSTP